jgi:hypothetical protein
MRKAINPFGLNNEQTKLFIKADLQTRIDGMKNIKDPKEKKPNEHKQEAKKAS